MLTRTHLYQQGGAAITGLMLELREIIKTGRPVVIALVRLVCAQHGHVVNGVQVPCKNTRRCGVSTGRRSQAGSYGIAVPQRLVAGESDRIPQIGMDRSERDVH